MTVVPTTARQRTTARALAFAGALGLLAAGLTGCGGGDEGTGDQGDRDEEQLGVLDAMFRDAWENAVRQDPAQAQARVEELIAECMAEQGFEYVPRTAAGPMPQAATAVEDDGLDPIEYAQQWGYAITTGPPDEGPGPSPSPEVVDPNEELRAGMTETERTAYDTALWGVPLDPADGEEYVEPTGDQRGCHTVANDAVYGSGVEEDDPFADLMDEMSRMWESVGTDDRVLAAQAEWAACMTDAGHPGLASVGDGEKVVLDLVQPILDEVWATVPEDAAEEERRAAQALIDERTAAITPQEIEIAVADMTCREQVRYEDVYAEVDRDLQQQFYDAHRAELEQWVAHQQEQSG